MTQSAATTTVRRHVVVNPPIDDAIRVFTERFGDFKPREHNLLRSPIAEIVFEPRVGGHIYDRAMDGSECRWARIAFDPPTPRRLQLGHQPALVARDKSRSHEEVEVRFIAETRERTRVELEHRHLEHHGAGWEFVRDGVGGDGGWPLYLQRYAALFEHAV